MAVKDTEMTPAAPLAEDKKEETKPVHPQAQTLAAIKHNFALLDRAVSHIEPRFTARVLRTLTGVRRRVNQHPDILRKAIEEGLVKDTPLKRQLLEQLPATSDVSSSGMDVDSTPAAEKKAPGEAADALPEVEAYLRLLVLVWLIDEKYYEKGLSLAEESVRAVTAANRRTLDQLGARLVFYYGRLYELTDRMAEIRAPLLALQRTASLRRDDETQATVLNLLLRNYFHHNLYDQADKLVARASFPTGNAANHQLARYLYYLGRIRAVQLNYTEAHTHLQQAIRRAPQGTVAAGFLQTAHKFFVIVELLMGDIPERGIFRQPILKRALAPYMHIVQAVRVGDLSLFQSTLSTYAAQFEADKTHTLILRLRHNVIKTGIRMISLAYSRISLRDVCTKLHLDSEEDAEYIVAKAIRDGVIDARVDHEKACMVSKESEDVYATNEPQVAFHQRINFCLQLHNESVKAMRYPLNGHKAELASASAARERERELAKEIADGDMDDSDDEW